MAVAREDASATEQALARANIDVKTIFSDGAMTFFGFNLAQNSTGKEQFDLDDIGDALDLEGIVYTIIDGKSLVRNPTTLDLDDKNLDNRMED